MSQQSPARGTATVDVRDMMCAQALALVAQTVEPMPLGASVDVLYNAEDVRHDLLVWALDRGHDMHEVAAGALRLTRR